MLHGFLLYTLKLETSKMTLFPKYTFHDTQVSPILKTRRRKMTYKRPQYCKLQTHALYDVEIVHSTVFLFRRERDYLKSLVIFVPQNKDIYAQYSFS